MPSVQIWTGMSPWLGTWFPLGEALNGGHSVSSDTKVAIQEVDRLLLKANGQCHFHFPQTLQVDNSLFFQKQIIFKSWLRMSVVMTTSSILISEDSSMGCELRSFSV